MFKNVLKGAQMLLGKLGRPCKVVVFYDLFGLIFHFIGVEFAA